MKNLKWSILSEKSVFKSKIFEMFIADSRRPTDGKVHPFHVIKTRDWCNIIPVTEDGKVVMVRQYRAGIDQVTLEIPGGIHDAEDLDLQSAAIREMMEETGYAPLPGARCVPVCSTHSNPAIINNRVHSFIVGPVQKQRDQKLDTGELIEVVEVPFAEIPAKIRSGEISHALMVIAFMTLAVFAPSGAQEGEKTLLSELRQFQRSGLPVQK